jgi:hypothetical protein
LKPEDVVKAFQPYNQVKNDEARAAGAKLTAEGNAAAGKNKTILAATRLAAAYRGRSDFISGNLLLWFYLVMSLPTLASPPNGQSLQVYGFVWNTPHNCSPTFWAKFYISQTARTRLAWEALMESVPPYDYYMGAVKVHEGEPTGNRSRATSVKGF